MGAPLVWIGWRPPGLSVPLPPLSFPAPKNSEDFHVACNNISWFNPVGAPHAGKPSLNAAQPNTKAEGCVHDDPHRADKLRKGWAFRVGARNIDSLTGRSGELVEALAERRIDVACVQEIRWRGSGCRFFGAIGKRYKLFWMGSKAKTDGVEIFVAEKWVDSVVSVETHSERVLVLKVVLGDCLLNVFTVYARMLLTQGNLMRKRRDFGTKYFIR